MEDNKTNAQVLEQMRVEASAKHEREEAQKAYFQTTSKQGISERSGTKRTNGGFARLCQQGQKEI